MAKGPPILSQLGKCRFLHRVGKQPIGRIKAIAASSAARSTTQTDEMPGGPNCGRSRSGRAPNSKSRGNGMREECEKVRCRQCELVQWSDRAHCRRCGMALPEPIVRIVERVVERVVIRQDP